MPSNRGETNKARRTTKHMKRRIDSLLSEQRVDYTSLCIMCKTSLRCTVGRPLPCSRGCREKLETKPLRTRLQPLLLHPSALDFLLGCVSAAGSVAGSSTPENSPQDASTPKIANRRVPTRHCLPDGFPLEHNILSAVVDSFPEISATTTAEDLIGTGTYQEERKILLSWLCTNFEGTLVPTSESEHIKEMPGEAQFVLANTNMDRQRVFEGNIKDNCPPGGWAAFHGTPTVHLLSILHSGLKQSKITDGSVWIAAHPTISLGYIMKYGQPWTVFKGWKNSAFQNHIVLFGVEVATRRTPFQRAQMQDRANQTAKCKQGLVMVKYVFLLPPQSILQSTRLLQPNDFSSITPAKNLVPPGDKVWPAMEKVFNQIHTQGMTRHKSVYYQELKSASEIIDDSRPNPSEGDDPSHLDDQPDTESEDMKRLRQKKRRRDTPS
ncbi:hypothetical protein F4776DRAFT_672956 [Hypoxylon sp. NC0597]|nr:hypothetical protein F4776DRAFT_672956 [Hypoxylon sp. NC0597]